jgi:ankyrin repeat protein
VRFMDEGTPIWNEVKFGNLAQLKELLRNAANPIEASTPCGRFLSTPLHEAISRGDIDMVNSLRRAGVLRDHRPVDDPESPFNGLDAFEYAKTRRFVSLEHNTIFKNLERDLANGPTYALMHAEIARMALERKMKLERPERQVAFGMGNLRSPRFNSYDIPDHIAAEIMKLM